MEPSAAGVPQGGRISGVLSHLSLHEVLDRWCERVVRPRWHGEASLIRSSADVVVWCQSRAEAQRCAQALGKRLATCARALEPPTTRLVAFGRCAERAAKRDGTRRETVTLLGFPLSGTRNRQGHCTGGWSTDQSRLRRSLATCHQLLQLMRPAPRKAPAEQSNQGRRGHDASYGVAGHVGRLLGVSRHGERSGRARRRSRRHKGSGRWQACGAIKRREPRQRPQLRLPYARLTQYAVLCIIVCRASCGQSARYVLWEPAVGDCRRRPGGVG
jgi:hypothetical protein